MDDEGGEFDTQYNRLMEEKMGEWKRSYYKGRLELSHNDAQDMG